MKTITISDGSQLDSYDTFDEALAAALADAEPGSIVAVHSEDCRMCDEDFEGGDEACTCEPLEMTAGAKA